MTEAPHSTPVVLTEQDRLSFDQWVDENPLRKWRLSQEPKKLSILEAAGRIGVGMSMVQMYEKGLHKPAKPEVVARMASNLGTDWSADWDAWLARRPD